MRFRAPAVILPPMKDESLLTLRQLAGELGLPESTIRYYRDAFLNHIPSVGTGRRRRYPKEAAAVLRSIAKAYASGQSKAEIILSLDHASPSSAAVATPTRKSPEPRAIEDVSNLDLLAAILDGEREQRDALWQMAKEIVRLTEVLEGQDGVLNEIADKAGVVVGGRPALHLAQPSAIPAPQPAPPPAVAEPPRRTTPAPEPVSVPEAPAPIVAVPLAEPPAATPAEPAPAPIEPAAAPPPPPVPEIEPPPVWAPPSWASAGPPVPMETVEPLTAPEAPGTPSGDLTHSEIQRLRDELESERALVDRLRESKLKLEHRAADAEAALEDARPRRQSVIKRILGSDDR